MRQVYYSLANPADRGYEQQWTQSIRSLRRYNPAIPVCLLLFNGASEQLRREAVLWNVTIRDLGDYRAYLERLHPRGATLALYPTFHKFLALRHAPVDSATQILFVDCDTFFFANVERLFDSYSELDWYARVEPGSRLCHYGYDPEYLDEEMLNAIAHEAGARPLVPFNSGVCLLNNRTWTRVTGLADRYLDLAWRLLCGAVLATPTMVEADLVVRERVLAAASAFDRSRTLRYPSQNLWIIEQVALWLALGLLPDLSQGLLSREAVIQGGEFYDSALREHCVVAHYFGTCERAFFAAVPAIPP
jgi:hypothetical protein